MIDENTIEQIREDFYTGSWALWSERFPRRDSVESPENGRSFVNYVKANSMRLRPEVVLLGLNPSGPYPSDLLNFHSTQFQHNDIWLRTFVEEAGLEGAYMTDIIEVEEPDSGEVDIEEASLGRFSQQLGLLDQDDYTIIAFGRDTFRVVASFGEDSQQKRDDGSWVTEIEIDGRKITLYGVYHYSQVNPEYVEKLRNQLGRIGSNLS